jgi:Ca-activated chloride channel family protein
MKRSLATVFALVCVLQAGLSWAQGVLVVVDQPVPLPRPVGIYPPHPRPIPRPTPVISYKIKELAVQARFVDQVAKVQVSQSFVNTGSAPMEVQFLFPLPYDGAIDKMTLLVDGKEFPAKLLPAMEARAVYESIVRSSKDPALLEWIGTGMFQTSVFPVPPGAERKVALSYNQLLRKDQGLTDFVFPLSTAKYTSHPVERVDIQVHIESGIDIKNVYSPTHSVDIRRPDPRRAVVSYTRANDVPAADFRLFFDVDKGALGTSVLTYRPHENEDGYFLLLTSPQVKAPDAERPKKTVMFVLDRSGSMSGKKIEQAKAALKFVLENLREGDLFNIVAYDSAIESFRPELEKFNDETRRAALGFVESIHAGGGTNIHGALSTALAQLKDSNRPNYVIFLTDGLPTVGETNEGRIATAAKTGNTVRARLLNFGVGYDVNSRLLDRLSRDNFGQSEYVRPDEDIEAHVSRVYSRISSPALTDVSVTIAFDRQKTEEGPPVSRLYPKSPFDLFEGEQLVLVGRYRKSGAANVTVKGQVAGQVQQYDFPANFVEKSRDESYGFVEKLWAMRRIGEIIDELDLSGRNDELVKELVELSTRHGILTPYTSFLADETNRPLASAENLRQAREGLSRLEAADGKAGVAQRAAKGSFQNATNAAPATEFGGIAGGAVYRDIETDREVLAINVRQAGNKALYARKKVQAIAGAPADATKQIIVTPETAELDLDKDMDKIEIVERFSKKYFELVKANSVAENHIFAQQQSNEELLVRLRGQNYLVR